LYTSLWRRRLACGLAARATDVWVITSECVVIVHISVAQAARLRAGSPRYRRVGNHQVI